MKIVNWFILRVIRNKFPTRIVTFADDFLFWRWNVLWADEWDDHSWETVGGKDAYPIRPRRLPWWRPFNAFLHCWRPAANLREETHDHPRWSITVCLRGEIIERTPWATRVLRPGSIVVRSHKYIHSFEIPAKSRGKTWTLFIVGRRKHRQNSYKVTAQ